MNRKRWILILLSAIFVLNIAMTQVALAEFTEDSAELKAIANDFICNCGCNENLKDCESETCNTSANLKEIIVTMLDEGTPKADITSFLRTNYGDELLAAPPKEGFNWMAYVTPFIVVIGGTIGLTVVLLGWVKRNKESENLIESGEEDQDSQESVRNSKYKDKLKNDLDNLEW